MFKLHKKPRKLGYKRVTRSSIDRIITHVVTTFDKEFLLDLGSGDDPDSAKYIRVDIDEKTNPDILCDLRTAIGVAPYSDLIYKYPDINKLTYGGYKLVRAKHIVEHIEWIYQEALFRWIYELLDYDGIIYIETPNVDHAIYVYKTCMDNYILNKKFDYPCHEYAGLKDNDVLDLIKWLNFKLHSGCSPGDYHLTSFTPLLLYNLLKDSGFKSILINDGETILAIASKE